LLLLLPLPLRCCRRVALAVRLRCRAVAAGAGAVLLVAAYKSVRGGTHLRHCVSLLSWGLVGVSIKKERGAGAHRVVAARRRLAVTLPVSVAVVALRPPCPSPSSVDLLLSPRCRWRR